MRPVKSMVVSKAEKEKNRGNGTRLLSFRKHLNKNGKPPPPTSKTFSVEVNPRVRTNDMASKSFDFFVDFFSQK